VRPKVAKSSQSKTYHFADGQRGLLDSSQEPVIGLGEWKEKAEMAISSKREMREGNKAKTGLNEQEQSDTNYHRL
jgi:hypothetical protein